MAAGNTYVALATQTLGSAAASVTFSSISSGYTDLVLICNAKNDTASNQRLQLNFNGDYAFSYSYTRLYGSGTAAISDRFSAESVIDLGFFGGTNTTGYLQSITNIQNYSNATTFKSVLNRWNSQAGASGAQYTAAVIGLWRNTSTINTLALSFASANIAAGSTFSLYGIAAA